MNKQMKFPLFFIVLTTVLVGATAPLFQPVAIAKSVETQSQSPIYGNSNGKLYFADGTANTPSDRQLLSNYNQAILSNPKDAVAYYKRAKLKYKLNDKQGALADYNQAILLDPKFSLAYNNRALLKADKLNDLEGALADYNQAILLDPKFSLAYLGRWNLKLDRLKDYQGALEDYTKFREIMMLKAMDP
jgi:tetratricopeptide (TPR) repeat protein